MVYVYYKVFHYTNLVMFSETSMQSDALCPPISKTDSIGIQYFFTIIKYQINFIMDDD
jgi:hypothetical protein